MACDRRKFLAQITACSLPLHEARAGEDDAVKEWDNGPDWSLISTWEGRRIRKVNLNLDALTMRKDVLIPVQLRFTSSAPQILGCFERLDVFRPLHEVFNCNTDAVGGFGSGANAGELTIETTKDKVSIRLTRAGFVLNSEGNNFRHVFYSAYLAELIGMIFVAQTGRRLAETLMDALSGLDRIKAERRACDECVVPIKALDRKD